ncbi:MAG: histidine kinase [Ferruginibacter sp.]|nr:histidine kinase [Ferruginibacter sp.]
MIAFLRNIAAALLLQIFSFSGYAQDSSLSGKKDFTAPAPFILTDTLPKEFSVDITDYVTSCRDGFFDSYIKNGQLDTETTQQPYNELTARKSLLHPVNEINIFFSVQNTSALEKYLYFECGSPDLLKLVNINDPERKIQTGGFLGHTNRVSTYSPNRYLILQLPPGKTSSFLVYLKFMGSYKQRVVPVLLSEKAYQARSIANIDRTRLQLIYHSFIIGGIFIISLFMFVQFFLNKDKAYLFYAAYGLCISLLSEKIMELNCNIHLISHFIPYYVFYSHIILQLFASFFYIEFLRKLLNISKKEKRIWWYSYVIQRLILVACIAACTVFFIPENSAFAAIAYNYGAFVSTICMIPLLVLLILSKKKDPAIKFVIAGFSAVVLGTVTVIYINRSGLYQSFNLFHPISILEFAFILEMICFGMALGYKTYKQKLEKETMALQKSETEIAALKAQMNPHFIFNCINSIDAFIHSNDKYNATLYLNKFAKLLRNILDSSKQNAVAFTKDVETLRLYIELEELRHENKFKTSIQIDDALLTNDYKVPPLIIQPFVENAILHGLKNREDNDGLLQIQVKKAADKIEYIIRDNGIGRKAAGLIAQNKESSYGMQMSFDRIKLFNGEENPSVQIMDLHDDDIASGTEVKVFLNII